MQEEVEQKIVILIENTAKLTEQEFKKAIEKFLQQTKMKLQKAADKKNEQEKLPKGKMSVKELAAQNKGMQSIEVTNDNIGSFNRVARKYGIDFAPYKVKAENRYLVFFKSGDMDAMTAAFKEYTAKAVRKAQRPSVVARIHQLKELIVAPASDKTRRRERER